MPLNHPSVSFLIATYNRAVFLEKCLESILSQSVQDYEVIIIDDGSTDNTEELVKNKYAGKVIYSRNPKNRGVAFSRNAALELASGEFLALLDSDDVLLNKDYLKTALRVLDSNRGSDIFCCDAYCIDVAGNQIGPQTFLRTTLDYHGVSLISGKIDFDDMFLRGMHSCGALVRRQTVKINGFLNLDYKIAWDEDFLLRCTAAKPGAIYYCDMPLTGYRKHNTGNLSNNSVLLYLERIRCRKEILLKNKFLGQKLGFKVRRRFAELNFCLIDAYLNSGNVGNALICTLRCLWLNPLIITKLISHGFNFLFNRRRESGRS